MYAKGWKRYPTISRRELLRKTSTGFGALALSALLAEEHGLAAPSIDGKTHFPAKAKNVIFCFMDGGPSHIDLFDYKPMLNQRQGEEIGKSAVSEKSQSTADRVWLGTPWEFQRRGKSGIWVSELLPHITKVVDEICLVRSMVGEVPLHGQQNLLMHTGRLTGRSPSFGSWVSYGLGSERDNLPNYVLLDNGLRVPNGGWENFSNSFLPASHAPNVLRARNPVMENIMPTDHPAVQRRKLDLLREQSLRFAAETGDSAIEAVIKNYETAFHLQTAMPELADVSGESEATRKMYGLDSTNEYKKFYSLQCLRARRLVERGVRFVEVACPLTHANNSPWDQHTELKKYHEENCMITDQGVAALIQDLKQRGLLDSTIVLWGGEMGRTPHTPKIKEGMGRDHHVNGYAIFLTGGGFKPGYTYGTTDEFGNSVVEKPTSIHSIHATILHQLGLDHDKLTFRFGGRDMSLTDVHGEILKELLV